MLSITITLPNQKGFFKLSCGKGKTLRKDPTLVYRYLERKVTSFLRTRKKEKMRLRVYKDTELVNEIIHTSPNEFLYVAACFLEDYLNDGYRQAKEKYYFKRLNAE